VDCYWPSLIGPNGPLPHFVTEQAISERLNKGPQPLCDLLDMVGGRFIALFYRAWTVGMPAYEADDGRESAACLVAMRALHGPAPATTRHSQRAHVSRFLGLPRSRAMLRDLLNDAFGLTVEIEQFVGTWLAIPPQARSRLGEAGARIGHGLIVGTRTWDRRCRIRVHVRGGSFAMFLGFLPGQPSRLRLDALLRSFLRSLMEWDVQYELPASEVPPARFGGGMRLGFSTWLGRPRQPMARVRLPKTRYHPAATAATS
jgi:type VI secretion system protein ImpH